MTNNEAIQRIKDHMNIHFKLEYPRAMKIMEALNMAVEALKTLNKEKWIKASEMLPEYEGSYLCTICRFKDAYVYTNQMIYYQNEWCWSEDPIDTINNYTHRVIAWKPMPESYKEDLNESN